MIRDFKDKLVNFNKLFVPVIYIMSYSNLCDFHWMKFHNVFGRHLYTGIKSNNPLVSLTST